MSVEVSLNTPLADALSNVVQPKLSEVGWSTGGTDDSALGEYIILMLVNGKTQEQIAAELSNDLLNLQPDDTGATDFTRWLFEQVDILNSQLNGIPQPQAQQHQVIPSHQDDGGLSRGVSGGPHDGDADMTEAIDGLQHGQIPTGPKSMRNPSRNGNKRMIGQISKAMDRSNDAILHRVRPQQGTERINMHNRQPPKGPRNGHNGPPRPQPNGRPMGMANGSGAAPPVMQMTPQQQMQVLAMMSQMFSPQQQQMFMPGIAQPARDQSFHNGAQSGQQSGRSLFERVESNSQRQTGNFNKKPQPSNGGFQSHLNQNPASNTESMNGADCRIEGCKFTHVKIMCKFNPCKNPSCAYKHAEGQKGVYPDKVWVADEEKKHVSERKFLDDEMGEEELVLPDPKVEDIKAEDQANASQTSSLEDGVVT
ncbi:nuclear polyadenylated RNA-binding protein NAB2, partial [Lecanoromycetidae sp. Uapishka_2]